MRKKLTRALGVTLMISMAAGMLAGCGGGKETTTPETTTPEKEQEQVSTEPVTITYWEQADPVVYAIWDELVAEFQTQNPHITVQREHYETEALRQQFMTTAQAGEGPELVYGPDDNLGIFQTAGVIQPVKNVVGDDLLGQLDEVSLEGNKILGELYGVPDRNGNALMLMYNKKYVDQAPETWEDLIAKAKEVQAANKGVSGLVYEVAQPFFFAPFLGGFGGTVFKPNTAEPDLGSQGMIDALKFAHSLRYEHQIVPQGELDYNTFDSMFKEGNAAFAINGPWSISQYRDDAGIDLGVAVLPKHANGTPSAPFTSTKTFMINKNVTDPNKKAAVAAFLKFINSKEAQLKHVLITNEVPTNKDAQQDPAVTGNEMIAVLTEQVGNGSPMPIIPQMRAVWDGIRPSLENVMAGKATPEAAAAEMQKATEKNIVDMGL